MTERRKRMALSVPPEVKKIYDDAADAAGMTTSKLIVQILAEAAPAVKKMGLAIGKAKSKPAESLQDLSSLLDNGSGKINDLQMDIEDQIKDK